MAKYGKKYLKAREVRDSQLAPQATGVAAEAALAEVKKLAYAKFDETIDLHIRLGIDPAKPDQAVRGSVVLPHNPKKIARVIVFAKGEPAEQGMRAGADIVG